MGVGGVAMLPEDMSPEERKAYEKEQERQEKAEAKERARVEAMDPKERAAYEKEQRTAAAKKKVQEEAAARSEADRQVTLHARALADREWEHSQAEKGNAIPPD